MLNLKLTVLGCLSLDKSLIRRYLSHGRDVLLSCVKSNGAIVAAPTHLKRYPKEAKDYNYVWVRDAYYVCKALSMLGVDARLKFISWCMKTSKWRSSGLFFEKYHLDGIAALDHFQPDQTGYALLIAHEHLLEGGSKSKDLQRFFMRTAEGLCRIWQDDHFSIPSQDIWEERFCFPDLKEAFTYSAAICARGLMCAYDMLGKKKYQYAAREMIRAVRKNISAGSNEALRLIRSGGRIPDYRIDSSLLGVWWPGMVLDSGEILIRNTVRSIEKRLVRRRGVYRYEDDEYDGWMYENALHRKKGAGYWPLLNFWMSLYHADLGCRRKSLAYLYKPLTDLDGKMDIPEQIFSNDIQVSVSPLAWSHAMFVIAAHRLGLID